jgi:EcsC protein family
VDGKGFFSSAAYVADEALRAHDGDVEAAVDAIVRSHVVKGGAAGFVTSLGGFITLPVALPVNLLGFYLLATRMTAAVARVRGYDITSEQIRTAVLLTLVGAEADDLLRKANMVVPGGTLSNLAAQRLPGPALMVVQKGIGFRLLAQVGRSSFARLGRLVPIVGGAIGAGLDAYMLRRFASNAKRQFPTAVPVGASEPQQVVPA